MSEQQASEFAFRAGFPNRQATSSNVPEESFTPGTHVETVRTWNGPKSTSSKLLKMRADKEGNQQVLACPALNSPPRVLQDWQKEDLENLEIYRKSADIAVHRMLGQLPAEASVCAAKRRHAEKR